MSISGQNLTVVIVTLKSEQVVEGCINSIEPNIPIIIVENSNNIVFKKKIEDKFKNVQCVLTQENLGMGRGNNIGIKLAKTDYVYILNPDVVLEEVCFLFVLHPPHPAITICEEIRKQIKQDKILRRFTYQHPVFNNKTRIAQRNLWNLQGKKLFWFLEAKS